MGWTYSTYEGREKEGIYRVLLRNLEGKRPLGRPRNSCEDNIKNGSSGRRLGWGGGDGTGWIRTRGGTGC